MQGGYVAAELPSPPFPEKSFDLVCRVAREVRIFPLLALDGRPSPYVANLMDDLSGSWEVAVETVAYEFQRGGNQMMRVRRHRTEVVKMRASFAK